jgi:hypothetical protein
MDIINIISKLIDSANHSDNFLLALTMYINFYYENIVCEEKIMNYLVESDSLIKKLNLYYPNYTQRQLETTYIALTICVVISLLTSLD